MDGVMAQAPSLPSRQNLQVHCAGGTMRETWLAFLLVLVFVSRLGAQGLTICSEDDPPNQFLGPMAGSRA